VIADSGDPPGAESKAKVFISYSRKDMAFVDGLEAALKARGVEPLIDRSEIYAFEDWWKRIEALIVRADAVVFIVTPDSVGSEVALKEIEFASSLNKRVAPIVSRRVEDKQLPQAVARLNFIFFDDPAQFETGSDRLAEALATDIGWVRQHTDFGEAARRWALAKTPNGLLLRSPALEEAERWIASRPRGAPEPTAQTQAFVRRSRQAATRRRNILTGSLSVGLVVALSLAGLAYWQRGIAVEQRDNATRNFKLAQKTAESLVFDIAHGLRNVRGMSAETVRRILETARATFEQLAASAADDLGLQRSRAAMLDEFGETYMTLGAVEEALKAFSDSLAIAERLTAADPSNTGWQADLSVAYEKIGNVLVAQGKLEEALKAFSDSLAIRERLAAADPSNTEWQHYLSISYEKIGAVLEAQGKLEEALKAYRDALAIRERLAAGDRSNTQWQRALSLIYNNIGDALVAQGKLDEALKAYRDGLAIAERLAAGDPSNTQWQRSLSLSYEKVGDVLMAQDKLDEALKAYRDSLDIFRGLAAADPSNTEWQRDLALSSSRVGEVLMAQGKLEEALKAYRETLAIRERVAAADPGHTHWQRDVSVAYNEVGDVLVAQGKLDEALKAFRDGLAIAERLAAGDPSNTGWQRDLSVSYNLVGYVLAAQGKLEEALKAYRDSLAIRQRLVAADPSNTGWQRDLQYSISKVGGLAYNFVLVRRFATALEVAEQAIALAPREIWLHSNRAHALMFLDRVDEARGLYLKFRGEKRVSGDNSWEAVILEDFAELRKAGLAHPLMEEIERRFAARG
jgi:tetratricopeptide (TPR) repeat protein